MKIHRVWPGSHIWRALDGYRWFQCRHCGGIFIVGRKIDCSVTFEAKAAHAHEEGCKE